MKNKVNKDKGTQKAMISQHPGFLQKTNKRLSLSSLTMRGGKAPKAQPFSDESMIAYGSSEKENHFLFFL